MDVTIIYEYSLYFQRTPESDGGYSFPCDKDGNVFTKELKPPALANYEYCVGRHRDGEMICNLETREIKTYLCSCGSGMERWPEHDNHGIFVAYVCGECRKKKLSKYDPIIFDDYDAYEEKVAECGERFDDDY